MFEKVKTIFFDYDGTLHNSIKIYEPAFKKGYEFLVSEGYAPKKIWKTNEIAYWLGFSSKDMWQKFLPNLNMEVKMQASKIISSEMKKLTEEGKATLYEGAIDTLRYLKEKGYHLVFISNCGLYYMESHDNLFSLSKYFDAMVCSEAYNFIPKHEILKEIKKQYPEEMVIVGDRIHDIESGIKNNIYTIGCGYGYGSKDELKDSNLIIHDIRELTKCL